MVKTSLAKIWQIWSLKMIKINHGPKFIQHVEDSIYGKNKSQFKKDITGELGHENSLYHLAYCYEKGDGVPQDVNKAIELYEKCAKSGDHAAKRKIEKLKK